MPRSIDPSTIHAGAGHEPQVSTPTPDSTPVVTASHVTLRDAFGRYFMGLNVEGALGELAALVPPIMGEIGSDGPPWLGSQNTGVPDWGVLKLRDGVIAPTGNSAADVKSVYPYYYRAPLSVSGVGVTGTGLDAPTDPIFNYYDVAGFPTYTGCGIGQAHAGFVTVSMGGGAADGFPTWRLIPGTSDPAVVVSGIVSPADRGVLALVSWAPGDTSAPAAATSVGDVQDRVLAAILLGKGSTTGCDGTPGGIFQETANLTRAVGSLDFTANPAAGYTVTINLTAVGGPVAVFTAMSSGPVGLYEFLRAGSAAATATNFARAVNTALFPRYMVAGSTTPTVPLTVALPGTEGNSVVITAASLTVVAPTGGGLGDDTYGFPSRIAGQFHLDEIHRGTTVGSAVPFKNPAAGQVRLLTDESAFPGVTPAVVAGGIPVLGATSAAVGTLTPASFPFGIGGGTDGNFFAYRLPYLDDYNVVSGVKYTPGAEKTRFSTKISPASPGALTQAGGYDDFTADFWAFQIARYRHRFVINAGAPGSLRRDGSYALVHFKREADFESYVRDGVVPQDSALYSVDLLNWSGGSQLENSYASGATAQPYRVQRSEVTEDPGGGADPTLDVGSTYTLTTTGDTMECSGVSYYVPRDPSVSNAPALGITTLDVTLDGVFDTSYRSHDKVPVSGALSSDLRRFALNQNPLFLSLSSFSTGGTESSTPTSTINVGSIALFPGSLGQVRRQRIEFGYMDLNGGLDNPAAGTPAIINATAVLAQSVTFAGDPQAPAFTTDARLRAFVRRPLAVNGDELPLPYAGGNTASSRGFTIPEASGDTVLYHGMVETSAATAVPYGNPLNTANVGFSSTKDKSEYFLDEIYRYPVTWAPLTVGLRPNLVGPGLPDGISPLAVPVRPVASLYTGWYGQGMHSSTLASGEAQVAGLPARNPDASEGVTSPFPARGILVYPQTDYSTGYAPPGPDYSALTGDRVYVRAFDAGAGNTGATSVILRLSGVILDTFAYDPTSPGGIGSQGMAVMVKVPGMTTWMDAGRVNGAGPSKQDSLLDGAGCQVLGPNTFSGVDTVTQIRYAQVEVNVGPTAALFLNAESPARCPILVKVVLKDTVTGKALNFEQGGEDGPSLNCRGLIGIDVNPAA